MFTIMAVVIAVVALGLSHFGVFGPSAEDCRPVKDLLQFNQSQGEQIAAKSGDSEGVPNVGEEGAYQAWADGLAERAQNVHDPDLARDATQLASLANESVGKFSNLRGAAQSRAPGAPAPPQAGTSREAQARRARAIGLPRADWRTSRRTRSRDS